MSISTNRQVVVAHPSGNQFFRHLVAALHRAGLLAEACTSIDWNPRSALARVLPQKIAAELSRRSFSAELGFPVAQHPLREVGRLLAGRLGWTTLTRHEIGPLSPDAVYRNFGEWVARRLPRLNTAGAVYAYEDAAEAAFLTATKLGWERIYDLPIAHWATSRRLLDEEAQRWPTWEPTLIGTRDSSRKNERKSRELALADVVVCPSRFVAESLPSAEGRNRRIVIAPFGSPPPIGITPRVPKERRLRVLFAGAMTQRKGLADLFAAMRSLRRSDIELVVLGSPVVDLSFYRREYGDFTYEPPRPHAEVLNFMATCDVFCLPSIVEGRALVVQEAMSAGLPIIVTPNTGTDDMVEEGRNGFVVPIRSPEVIAEKLTWFADNRTELAEFGAAARAAATRVTWESYAAQIIAALRK